MFCENCGKPEPKRNQAAMIFALPNLCLDCSKLSSIVHRRYDTATGKPLENKSNICERCGGQKTVYIKVEPVYSNGFVSAVHAQHTSSTMKICMCPLPKKKHDGRLEPMVKRTEYYDHTAQVEILDEHPQTSLISISGGYSDESSIYLDPKQVLSLLAWLKQEQSTLERLVQEEAKDDK